MAEEGPVVIAEVSEKGGVGKTSVTAGLIAVAAELGLRVAGVDLDPRATLTDELGVTDPEMTVDDIYFVDPKKPPQDPAEIARKVLVPAGEFWPSNVFVLPSERAFGNRENDPATGMEFRLKRALWGLRDLVDIAFLDVPPRAGGKLVGSALLSAQKVLIPATLTDDGYLGAKEAMTSIGLTNGPGGLNGDLEVAGIVRSIVPRQSEYRQIHADWDERLREEFGDLVLPAVIKSYAIREVCRTGSMPITAAPGREAALLKDVYRSILFHALPHLKEIS